MNIIKKASFLLRAEESLLIKSKINLSERIKLFFNQWKSILLNKRKINYFGKDFFYDNRYAPILLGEYPEEIERINKHLSMNNIRTVIDIGANIGQWGFTIKSLYPKIKLLSIEPNKEVFGGKLFYGLLFGIGPIGFSNMASTQR